VKHFQAKWDTWRPGKCDQTRIYSGFSLTARTNGPHFAMLASIAARILAGSLSRTSAYREARRHRMFFGSLQRHSGKPIAQPSVKAYRQPVTKFRRPYLKRA
jgi:hypothetical protein